MSRTYFRMKDPQSESKRNWTLGPQIIITMNWDLYYNDCDFYISLYLFFSYSDAFASNMLNYGNWNIFQIRIYIIVFKISKSTHSLPVDGHWLWIWVSINIQLVSQPYLKIRKSCVFPVSESSSELVQSTLSMFTKTIKSITNGTLTLWFTVAMAVNGRDHPTLLHWTRDFIAVTAEM